MNIIVILHTKLQEEELLVFLEQRKFEYLYEEAIVLSEEQQLEILIRDEECESGKAESFSLDEIIDYFDISGN
jgi:hypothetical protein